MVFRSVRRCECWLELALPEIKLPHQPTSIGARPLPAPGWRRRWRPCAIPLGACLADDMGLGKTIQVLSLLLVIKNENRGNRKPCLLVAPASLLANWAAEISRFAPSLNTVVVHPSAAPSE